MLSHVCKSINFPQNFEFRTNLKMSIVENTLATFLGAFFCTFLLIFLILSAPVYLFRLLVILLAKCFRPDLSILSGQSAIFFGDYMGERAPRSNVIFALIFEGHLTVEQVQNLVLKNWIQTKDRWNYENFQRYPVSWLGFTFWKDVSDTFRLEKHIHKYSGNETLITDKQLTEIIEVMLNKKMPKLQSPWALHLIENYKNPNVPERSTKQHSVLIFQWHHCLADGIGAMTALVEGLFKQQWKRKLAAPLPEVKGWAKMLHMLATPINVFFIISSFFSHLFRRGSFKVPNATKHWYQVCANSGQIQIEDLKNIKNAFKVSYTSVLLSAMSAAVYKTLGAREDKSMLCMSMLLARNITKRKMLANHMAGALVDLQCSKFSSPVERLKVINQLFENSRASIVPVLGQNLSSLLGSHAHAVNSFLMDNKMTEIGLTNLAGVQTNIELNENIKWINTKFVVGGFSGDLGVNIAAISHGGIIEIFASVERALMSRNQAEKFVYYIKEEIENLRLLMPTTNTFGKV